MGILKAAGKWLYGLATTLGGFGLLIIAMADSSFVSIPEGSDLLIVVLSIGKTWGQMIFLTLMTIIGSVIGCHLLFFSGRYGGRAILEKRFKEDRIRKAEAFIHRYGVLSILVPSILPPPMPFKIFVLTAGVFRMATWRFFVAVLIGRSLRYFMWGILAVIYGEQFKIFLTGNLHWIGILLFFLTLLATICILIWNLWRRSRAKTLLLSSK